MKNWSRARVKVVSHYKLKCGIKIYNSGDISAIARNISMHVFFQGDQLSLCVAFDHHFLSFESFDRRWDDKRRSCY